MRFIPLIFVSLTVGAGAWACGGDDGSDPSNTGGQGGTSGDGDGDTESNTGDGDTGDTGDGDGDGDETNGGDGGGEGTGGGGGENCEGCWIDGQCYSDGAANPENGCQVCDAPEGDWSDAADGMSCGEHGSCDAGACGCADSWTGPECGTCVVYVKTDGDDEDSGASWSDAVSSVQVALDLAAERLADEDLDSCQVWVAEGTYKPGTLPSATFQLRENVAIYGGFAGNETALGDRDWGEHETILSGDVAGDDLPGDLDNEESPLHREDNVYHVVTGANDAPLDGLIIRGGGNSGAQDAEDGRGGGLLNLDAAPTVRNCLFEDNYARFEGTAIYTEGSDAIATVSQSNFERNVSAAGSTIYFGTSEASLEQVLLRDNVNAHGALSAVTAVVSVKEAHFVTNEADSGAAIYAAEESELWVEASVFDANISAGNGGAVSLLRSKTSIKGATFSNNSAADLTAQDVRGGALIAAEGETWIANCGFYDNSAQGDDSDYGGAIENWAESEMSIVNSVFVGNTALAGSAIRNEEEGSTLDIVNSSFFGNSPSGTDGTLSNLEGDAQVTNSIFWGGSTPEISHVDSPTTETNVTFSDVEGGYTGEGNLEVDPEFVDESDGDVHLASDSPVINQGDHAHLPDDLLDLDDDGDRAEVLPVDLDGNDRVVGSSVDMGAYEYAE